MTDAPENQVRRAMLASALRLFRKDIVLPRWGLLTLDAIERKLLFVSSDKSVACYVQQWANILNVSLGAGHANLG